MPVKSLRQQITASLRKHLEHRKLSPAAKEEMRRDRRGLPSQDPGHQAVIDGAIGWLCDAQDHSKSQDGGVARDYSLLRQWATSYPETTGYIIPTFLAQADRNDSRGLRERARRMLDWLVGIQMESGAFQAGKIDSRPTTPVTFNTGQILLGLASGESAFGNYGAPLQRAADWLVATQDPDGCWRRFPTPFAASGEKAYETHVAWGLLEAARLYPNRGYAEAALKNIHWAIGKQRENGWLADCCLTDPSMPLTHTLGYALRGILEGQRFSPDSRLAAAARRLADGLLSTAREDGFLPGRLNSNWGAEERSACLTGTAQVAHCWLMMFESTGDRRYLDAAVRGNAYVRRSVRLDAPTGIRGGVKGSFPIDGGYGSFEYLNWAAKFLIDSLTLEQRLASVPR